MKNTGKAGGQKAEAARKGRPRYSFHTWWMSKLKYPSFVVKSQENYRELHRLVSYNKYCGGHSGGEFFSACLSRFVVSDGLACFNAVTKAGCIHEPHIVGGGKLAVEHPAFKWVNTILGNVKNSLKGTYHSFRQKHIPRYLAEFQYRFNRRFDLSSMIPRLAHVAFQTPPMPLRLLTLAEKAW